MMFGHIYPKAIAQLSRLTPNSGCEASLTPVYVESVYARMYEKPGKEDYASGKLFSSFVISSGHTGPVGSIPFP